MSLKTPNQIRREAKSSQDLLDRLNSAMFSSNSVVRVNPFILRVRVGNHLILQDVAPEFNPFEVEPKGADPTVEDVLTEDERDTILNQVERVADLLLPIIEKSLVDEVALSMSLNQAQARFTSIFEGKVNFAKLHGAIQSSIETETISAIMKKLGVSADVAQRTLSSLQPTVNLNELVGNYNEKLRGMQTVPKVQR